jgi:hypothetical protein
MRALGQNPTESEVKKLVHEHRADDRVPFEVFLPIMQVPYFIPVFRIRIWIGSGFNQVSGIRIQEGKNDSQK